jgi:hypothetical protein
MSEYASTEDLVENGHDLDDVELSNGRKVQVRSYTRYELVNAGKGTEDPALIERRILGWCVVQPAMTAKQVEQWQKTSKPGDIAAVITRIRELSGMSEGAAKSDVVEVRD